MKRACWIPATTTHARQGSAAHSFANAVSYVLIDPEAPLTGCALFSRNRFNLAAVLDRDYGFAGRGQIGPAWARAAAERLGHPGARTAPLRLLTMPRILGNGFNPVSFWFFLDGTDAITAVLAEVNNTYGDRHGYLCHNPGFAPIRPSDRPHSRKVMHVSPFREVAGSYRFSFLLAPDRVAIRIEHQDGGERLVATLAGPLQPLRSPTIVAAVLRARAAPLRTRALIYWQALRLRLKGAGFRPRPAPPTGEVT